MHAQILMLVLGVAIFIPILNTFPTLHKTIAPIAWSGMIGAFLFGVGMQLGDGCGSGSIIKLSYNRYSQAVLLPFMIGSFLGTTHVLDLTRLGGLGTIDLGTMGIVPAIGIQLAVLLFLFLLTLVWKRYKKWNGVSAWNYKLNLAMIGIVLVSVPFLLLSGQQWGISYAFGLWGAKVASWLGFPVQNLEYWQQLANQQTLRSAVVFDITSLSNFGIVLGAWYYIQLQKKQKPRVPFHCKRSAYGAVLGGLLMGYGAQLAFGCNIGPYFSGISSGSLHGWSWFVFAFLGTILGLKLRKTFKYE